MEEEPQKPEAQDESLPPAERKPGIDEAQEINLYEVGAGMLNDATDLADWKERAKNAQVKSQSTGQVWREEDLLMATVSEEQAKRVPRQIRGRLLELLRAEELKQQL